MLTKADVDGCPMEALNPALDAPARGAAAFIRSVGLTVHSAIEHHRATVTTALIVILAFVVSIHFPDHGLPIHGPFHHPPR
jgi:hypothetical protein